MKKRVIAIFICINYLFLVLSACAPRLVGEAKAKEAGLAMIQQAYEVDLTNALVTVAYQEGAGVTYEDGQRIQYGTEEPMRFYNIRVNPDEENENPEYYAEVNAVTGVAYRADKNISKIVLTEEEQKLANKLGTLDEFNPDTFNNIQEDAMSVVVDLLQARLERDVPVFRMYSDMIESDSVDFPKVRLGYIVLMENDMVYDLTLLWPSMDLIAVNIRNFD